MENSIALKDTKLYTNSKDIQELKEKINGLLIKTNELETKDKNKSKGKNINFGKKELEDEFDRIIT